MVIDASAALAWLLPSQASDAAAMFLRDTVAQEYIAPFVFEWEVRNVLLTKLRQGQLPPAALDAALDALGAFEIACAEPMSAGGMQSLARMEAISLFDASYVALAIELGAGLASRDRRQLAAAARRDVPTFDLAPRR